MAVKGALAGKVVIVTGAGGGIGEGIAKLAAVEGARVLVNDLGGDAHGDGADGACARRVADEIEAAGGEAVANGHSIATWAGAQAIVRHAIDAFGRVDAVINNAGILRDTEFHEMDPADWDKVRAVNLDGYFYVSRAVAPCFQAQNGGVFVHMTSTGGLIGNRRQANYMASKLGVVGLSKSIAIDMERFNVRSNCIAPFGFTRMVATLKPQTEAQRRRVEFSRRMTPDKVAPLACALVADAAADVTGQIFGARMNELMLFSQNRPVRTTQTSAGWTVETVLKTALPVLRPAFHRLDLSSDVFSWEPF